MSMKSSQSQRQSSRIEILSFASACTFYWRDVSEQIRKFHDRNEAMRSARHFGEEPLELAYNACVLEQHVVVRKNALAKPARKLNVGADAKGDADVIPRGAGNAI